MEGLVPGRIVYFVMDEQGAAEINGRRTTSDLIAERMKADPPAWPAGAQAHIGNKVVAGEIFPAMVLRVWGSSGCSNLRVHLDGTDDYWAASVNYAALTDAPEDGVIKNPQPRTWHWMYSGQATRGNAK